MTLVVEPPATGMNAYSTLEIVPQRELDAAWFARGKDLSEERSEVGVLSWNPEVGVIEGIEKPGAELNRLPFANSEAAIQREIENDIARAWYGVAAGIAERIRLRRAEGVRVEPVVRGSLAARQ